MSSALKTTRNTSTFPPNPGAGRLGQEANDTDTKPTQRRPHVAVCCAPIPTPGSPRDFTTALVHAVPLANNAEGVCVSVGNNDPRRPVEQFTVDSFIDESDMEHVGVALYESFGASLGRSVQDGLNGCVMAYGQSGSGKSFAMFGTPQAPGVGVRILQDVIEAFGVATAFYETTVTATAVEMANERVRDALEMHGTFQDRKIRSHPELGTSFEGLTRMAVASVDDVDVLLRQLRSQRQRATDNTFASHFVVHLQMRRKDLQKGIQQLSALHLVDLGGSDKVTAGKASVKSVQLSLHMLRRVIEAAAAKKDGGPARRLPVKDTSITWLLGDVLHGNAVLACICCISRFDVYSFETARTLKVATTIRSMAMQPTRTEEKCSIVVHAIQQEMAAIQNRLQNASPDDRHEDFNRLQKELSFRAQKLMDEESRKTEAREALHLQVERTTKELDHVRHQLQNKQHVAATAEALQEELARLALSRDLAVKRMVEEEAMRRQTERQILEARGLEADLNRMRAEREKMEVTARMEQRVQSRKVFRNVFMVATAVEKDRHLMRELETRKARLCGLMEACTTSINSVAQRYVASKASIDELQTLEAALTSTIHALATSRSQWNAASKGHQTVMELARDQLQEHAVLFRQANPMLASAPPPTTAAVDDAHGALLQRCIVDELALGKMVSELETVCERLSVVNDATAASHRLVLEREEATIRCEGELGKRRRDAMLLDEQTVDCRWHIEALEKEVAFLEKVQGTCNLKIQSNLEALQSARGEVSTASPRGDEFKRILSLGSSSPIGAAEGGTSSSRAFRDQKASMQRSPLLRRFA